MHSKEYCFYKNVFFLVDILLSCRAAPTVIFNLPKIHIWMEMLLYLKHFLKIEKIKIFENASKITIVAHYYKEKIFNKF